MQQVVADAGAADAAVALPGRPSRLSAARDDLVHGIGNFWIWGILAWQDIRLRYRGSILGPFWLSLSMAIMIATLGVIYSTILKQPIGAYLPFLTLGLLFWTFISSVLTEGCNCFISAEAVIRQVAMPHATHVCRTVCRNLIVLAHNAVVYVIVAWLFAVPISGRMLLVVPALALQLVNGIWVALLLGMICARFRDVVPIVASVIQIIFFTTPILWLPNSLGGQHQWIIDWNPFYAIIEIARAPLLGQPESPWLWLMASAVTVAGSVATFFFFARFRARIPYWV